MDGMGNDHEQQNENATIESSVQDRATVARQSPVNRPQAVSDKDAPKVGPIKPHPCRDLLHAERTLLSDLSTVNQTSLHKANQEYHIGNEVQETIDHAKATKVKLDVNVEHSREHQRATDFRVARAIAANCPLELTMKVSRDTISSDSNAEIHRERINVASREEIGLPYQRFNALPAKAVGFMESLTTGFAPDTKALWTQMFGPRYANDNDEQENWQQDNKSSADRARLSIRVKSSVQAKLARERKLDEQIQASQQRFRERVWRAAKREQVHRCKHSPNQESLVSPFDQARLSLTLIRYCTKRALNETCKSFQRLYARAREEGEDWEKKKTRIQGIYITQRELKHLLCAVFDSQELTSRNCGKPTLAAPLDFKGEESCERVSLNDQLQASWFLPFGQVSQLQNLVMKITNQRLNDKTLGIVLRNLRNQVTLEPFSAKLQTLILHLSNGPLQNSCTRNHNEQTSLEHVHDLLTCLAVEDGAILIEKCNTCDPFSLDQFTKVSSLVCIQRLVFFRYFINHLTTARIRRATKTVDPIAPVKPQEPRVRRKSLRRSISTRLSRQPIFKGNGSSNQASTLGQGAGMALSIASTAKRVITRPRERGFMNPQEKTGNACEKRASQLHQDLETALATLRQVLNTIDQSSADNATLGSAIRATDLIAAACDDSVLENHVDVDIVMSDTLHDDYKALHPQISPTQAEAITETTASLAQSVKDPFNDNARVSLDSPPPYFESIKSTKVESYRDSSPEQLPSPPPYAIAAPLSWILPPCLPESDFGFLKPVTASLSTSNCYQVLGRTLDVDRQLREGWTFLFATLLKASGPNRCLLSVLEKPYGYVNVIKSWRIENVYANVRDEMALQELSTFRRTKRTPCSTLDAYRATCKTMDRLLH